MIVDGGGFRPDANGDWQGEVIVVCDDHEAAVRALERAGKRILLVGSDAVERRSHDALEKAFARGVVEICEHVSEARMCERGPSVYLETASEPLDDALAGECFRIFAEELEAAGIEDALIEHLGPFDFYSTGEGIFLHEADAIELAPLPGPRELVAVIQRWLPTDAVLMLSGMQDFATAHASLDETPVRRGLPHRIDLDAETMRAFWQAEGAPGEPADPGEAPIPQGLNWMLLDDIVGNRIEPTREALTGFWQTVSMLVDHSEQVEAAQPTRDLMTELSAGSVPFDHAAWRALRDGAVHVFQAEWRAERQGRTSAAQQVHGVIVYRGDEVLVLAPEPAAHDRFRAHRGLPARALLALEAATRGAHLVEIEPPAGLPATLQLFDGDRPVGTPSTYDEPPAGGSQPLLFEIPFALFEHPAAEAPRAGIGVRIESGGATTSWPERP